MLVNYYAILVCAVASMVLGALWYGALFGKTWARLIGADMNDPETKKKMQKSMAGLYILQFIIALLQIFVLASYSLTLSPAASIVNAVWIWIGFVMPTTAGTCLWNNDSRKTAWTKFFIQMGYQFLCFVMFGAILGFWQ